MINVLSSHVGAKQSYSDVTSCVIRVKPLLTRYIAFYFKKSYSLASVLAPSNHDQSNEGLLPVSNNYFL